jgi:hypothetical protein
MQLPYITRHCATLITLHQNYDYSCNYTTSHYTTLHYTRLRYTRLHYANYAPPQLQLQLQLQLHYTMYTTLQLHLRYTTLQLQLPLHYTTLTPAGVGEVTTATSPTTPKNQTLITFRSIALPSMHHNNLSLL